METRIAGYDFARSLALFGLVAANFSLGFEIADFGLEHLIQVRLHSLMRGGAIATFLVLGGVGISLLTHRVRITNETPGITGRRKQLIRRAAALLLVGICCNLIWNTGLLGFYSLYIVIGALLLTVSNRWLGSLAFGFIIISVVFIVLIYGYFDYLEMLQSWDTVQDSDPWTVEGMVSRLVHSRLDWIFSWTTFLLIGMWLGRQDVRHPRVRRNMFVGGIVLALAAECAVWVLIYGALWLPRGFYPLGASDWLIANILIVTKSVDFFAPFGIAMLIIGASLMLTEKCPDAKWTKPFIATGQLVLTLYVAYLAIGIGLSKALEVLDSKTLPFEIGGAAVFCICAVIFSHFWRKRFNRGPLEWGIRRITG